jgi:hypothetical protein
MIGAASLDRRVYEEVERDPSATGQAALVVLAAAIAAGIGALGGFDDFIVGLVADLVGWAAYALIVLIVGTTIFKGPRTSSSWGELLRTIGFAMSPRVLLILGVIPVAGIFLRIIVFVWVLLTTLVAVREALDVDTGRARATAVTGWVALFVISFVLGSLVF